VKSERISFRAPASPFKKEARSHRETCHRLGERGRQEVLVKKKGNATGLSPQREAPSLLLRTYLRYSAGLRGKKGVACGEEKEINRLKRNTPTKPPQRRGWVRSESRTREKLKSRESGTKKGPTRRGAFFRVGEKKKQRSASGKMRVGKRAVRFPASEKREAIRSPLRKITKMPGSVKKGKEEKG